MKILLVDDDQDLVALLVYVMGRAGLEVLPAYDPPRAREQLARNPDLAIVDINLGPASGFDLVAEIRRSGLLPIMILTGRVAEDDKVHGFELGADDYMTKPFSSRELVARVRAHLRRAGHDPAGVRVTSTEFQVGPLLIDLARHSVAKDGRSLDLTVTEFRLLTYLASNANVVVPTPTILKHVWGYSDASAGDVVRTTLHRLRRKLGDDPNSPRFLQTVPGVGVMLQEVAQ